MTEQTLVLNIAGRFAAGDIHSLTPLTDGAVNETYLLEEADGRRFILQRLHPVFSPHITDTLATIVPYCAAAGVTIPEPLQTKDGELVVHVDGGRFRALSYVPGETVHDTMTPARAESAGRIVGRFHAALAGVSTPIPEALLHFHDTEYVMEELRTAVSECRDEGKHRALASLARDILTAHDTLEPFPVSLPRRLIHADLKISNIRFVGDEAVALIDLDTVMYHTIPVELGDALRSWCGVRGEDDPEQVFSQEIFEAALRGYFETATFLTADERDATYGGVARITLELAARFVTDAYRESYFALSPCYKSRFEQGKIKGENQFKLFQVVAAARPELEAMVQELWEKSRGAMS